MCFEIVKKRVAVPKNLVQRRLAWLFHRVRDCFKSEPLRRIWIFFTKERDENSLKQQAFGVPYQLDRPVLFRLGLFLGLNLPADLRTDKITRSFPDVLN